MRRFMLASAIAALPVAAQATAITPTSDLFVSFSGTGAGITGTAVAELNNFVFAGTSVTFDMTVTNTTTSPIDARFTALGWNTAPPSTTATDNTNIYATTTNVGLGPMSLSICLFSGPNCNGGALGGLEDPANAGLHGDPVSTGIFQVTINFAAAVPPLDFSSFDGKFQTANGSFFATGTVGTTPPPPPPPPPPPVSEPASLALLGTGLLGIGLLRRRQTRG